MLRINHVEDRNLTEEFVQDTVLWSVCGSHFNSTKILTIMVAVSDNRDWNSMISSLLQLFYEKLDIPIILVFLERISQSLLQNTNQNRVSFTTSPDEVREYPAESSHSYLLISYNEESASSYISAKYMYPRTEWTPKDNVLMLIIVSEIWNSYGTPPNYLNVFDQFWSIYWILNVIITVKNIDTRNTNCSILVHNRFDSTYGHTFTNVTLDQIEKLPRTYLERTWNLRGYDVKVTMFDSFPNAILKCEQNGNCKYEGRDWTVLENLATYMNFTAVVTEPLDGQSFGYHTEFNTFTGAMGALVWKKADISGNERYIKYYGTDKIEFTMPAFYTKKLVVIVPKAQRIATWKAISECFKFTFWIGLITVFLFSAILWYILRKLKGKVSYVTNVLDMVAIFLTMSLNFLTKVNSMPQRFLLSCCLLFSLVVMCLIQSSLLDVTTHPHYNREINSLKELEESKLPIVTLDPNLLDTFDESESMKNLALRTRYQNVSSKSLLEEIANKRNVSFLTSQGEAVWYLGKYPNKLHVVRDYPREYFVSYMIPKGSPYATRIHNLLGKMCQAGLVTKWDKDTSYNLQLKALSEGRSNYLNHKEVKVFKLVDFQLSFFVYGVGITASTVVLLVENLVGRNIRVRIYIVRE
ncbi:hypothetical protein ANN_12858 [Periplaneta americana]|uniref:Ionotropic receptor n=1 Tax=Periplaneta americana TaxID=6978 RepID=A0ABQ8TJZ0_PERAM|nr:hypothetical protein ANN_12858 [Periplaneta americana]